MSGFRRRRGKGICRLTIKSLSSKFLLTIPRLSVILLVQFFIFNRSIDLWFIFHLWFFFLIFQFLFRYSIHLQYILYIFYSYLLFSRGGGRGSTTRIMGRSPKPRLKSAITAVINQCSWFVSPSTIQSTNENKSVQIVFFFYCRYKRWIYYKIKSSRGGRLMLGQCELLLLGSVRYHLT